MVLGEIIIKEITDKSIGYLNSIGIKCVDNYKSYYDFSEKDFVEYANFGFFLDSIFIIKIPNKFSFKIKNRLLNIILSCEENGSLDIWYSQYSIEFRFKLKKIINK